MSIKTTLYKGCRWDGGWTKHNKKNGLKNEQPDNNNKKV